MPTDWIKKKNERGQVSICGGIELLEHWRPNPETHRFDTTMEQETFSSQPIVPDFIEGWER